HDLTLHRRLRVPMQVTLSVEAGPSYTHRAGRLATTIVTATSDGEELWATRMTSLFLGAASSGEAAPPPPPLVTDPVGQVDVPIAAGAAHVYTACARIWNPIHTDPSVAAAAGLPAPILHGTATLATAVSHVLSHTGWSGADVARIEGSFGAMVPMPSTLTVRFGALPGTFDVLLPD